MSINVVKIEDDIYPAMLKLIMDPPKKLWYMGNVQLLEGICISVVGSRKASEYGVTTAKMISNELGASGIHVVSGMAAGIDQAAHMGAINTKGKTIAVLGNGIDMEKTKWRKELLDEIALKGLVLSEYPPGYPASKYTFPRRNRIISGLSSATCVVEAGFNSGSLITAEAACDQGRCVYAVPGNIDSPLSLGTNKLIKDGAVPVITSKDILRDMGIFADNEKCVGSYEKRVLDIIRTKGEISLSELSSYLGKGKKETEGIVSVLELKGIVCTSMGKIFEI